VDGGADPLLALAPDGFELDPGRRDIDRAERAQVKTLGAAATVRDEIDLAEPGARVRPTP
jgi:predicted metallo-beta-lactamase superfamily hydrolase